MEITTTTQVPDEKLIPTDVQLLRPNQIQLMQTEVDKLRNDLNTPQIQMKGRVRRQLQKMEEQLNVQRPREVKGVEKDRIAKRVKELAEDLRSTMLTQEEMRKAPTGAPDYLLRWEKRNRKKVNELKNGLLMLGVSGGDYQGYETDIANLEKFRPEGATDRYRTDALVGGHIAMSSLAKANWPLGEPKVDTALNQATRAFVENTIDKVDGRKVISEERRAQLREALAKGRAKKKAMLQAGAEVIADANTESPHDVEGVN